MNILLDVNDTLINTKETAFMRNNYCLEKLGYPSFSLELFNKLFGKCNFPNDYLPNASEEEILKFLDVYPLSRMIYPYKSFFDINQWKDFFFKKKYNITLDLITYSNEKQLKVKLKEAGIESTNFRNMFHSNNSDKRDFFKNTINSKKNDYQIYISDDVNDYQFIDKNGIIFLGVLTGNSSFLEFKQCGLNEEYIYEDISAAFKEVIHDLS